MLILQKRKSSTMCRNLRGGKMRGAFKRPKARIFSGFGEVCTLSGPFLIPTLQPQNARA